MKRGFTLVELMVTVGIMGFVSVLILGMVLGFQNQQKASRLRRQSLSNVREALTYMERDVRTAGYGIEPALAFDFFVFKSGIGGPSATNYYCSPLGKPSGGSTCQRDCAAIGAGSNCPAPQGPWPDEIVFYSRNPQYWTSTTTQQTAGQAWQVTGVTATSVSVLAHGGENFPLGGILQLVCPGGFPSTYVTLNATTANAAAGAQSLGIFGTVGGNPYSQSPLAVAGCAAGSVRAFQIDRFHYYVDNTLTLADGSAPGFLMLDMGVDRNGDGVIDIKDLIPVATGVVDMQIAYQRPDPNLTAPPLYNLDRAGKRLPAGGNNPIFPSTIPAGCIVSAIPITGGSCPNGLRVIDFAAVGAQNNGLNGFSYLGFQQRDLITKLGDVRVSPDAANISAVDVVLVGRSLAAASDRPPQPLILRLNEAGATAPSGRYAYEYQEAVIPTPNTQAQGLPYL